MDASSFLFWSFLVKEKRGKAAERVPVMKEADRGEKEGGEKEGDPESRSARGCWRWKGLFRAKSGKVFPGLKARLGRPQVGDLKGWMKK